MRVLCLCIIVTALCVAAIDSSPSKKKKKFEGDFEFADESMAESKSKLGKERKTWISDPSSELCHALKCRKQERCLMEDSYTAVCVSKAELRRNGDLVVSRNKFDSTSTTPKPEDYDDEEDDYIEDDDDNESESEVPEKEGNNVDDDLGLEFYDLDINVDDDSASKKKFENTRTTTTTTPKYAILKRCNPCPVVKPNYICATNNITYSSLCKLDYFNCMNDAHIQVACTGFCPCTTQQGAMKKTSKEMRLADFEKKYKATKEKEALKFAGKEARVIFSPEAAKLKDELFAKNKNLKKTTDGKINHWNKNSATEAEDKEKERGYNDILPPKKTTDYSGCNDVAMETMGNRLLDWFSVLMSQPKSNEQKHIKAKAHFPATCAKEVKWMFGNLDTDNNAQLSLHELFDLEHNDREACMKPFIDRCDENRDVFLSTSEWCRCFARAERPCLAVRRRTKAGLLGSFVPRCDAYGFYQPLQCHGATGTCWCVDAHGVEQSGSRTRGRPDCQTLLKKNGVASNAAENEDNDLDVSDEVEEGSGGDSY